MRPRRGPGRREHNSGLERTKGEKPVGFSPFVGMVFGGVLLSHTLAGAVPLALKGLASGFGMGPGVSPSL